MHVGQGQVRVACVRAEARGQSWRSLSEMPSTFLETGSVCGLEFASEARPADREPQESPCSYHPNRDDRCISKIRVLEI